jgi:hypothetical protein
LHKFACGCKLSSLTGYAAVATSDVSDEYTPLQYTASINSNPRIFGQGSYQQEKYVNI